MKRALAVLLAGCLLLGTTGVGSPIAVDGVPSDGTAAADRATGTERGGATTTTDSGTERVLVVADADTGESILVVPVSEGTKLTLAYTHSVEKTPVRDVYTVNNRRLEMTAMKFQSFGAGLPSRAAVTREGDWFIFDPSGSYRRLPVVPGSVAGHELVVGDERYDLVALSGGEPVELFVAWRCGSR
ncbi:DUF1850 domain-containing protein [Halomicrococcus sp. NG-SE-24]|uniref:DUF1850 domain-containing protein n=1 Tax=Halomicrococcus sp. NG-SE-24 TaxID=3436928 RepID=UPI003D9A0A6D